MAVGVAPPCLPLTEGNRGGIAPTQIISSFSNAIVLGNRLIIYKVNHGRFYKKLQGIFFRLCDLYIYQTILRAETI